MPLAELPAKLTDRGAAKPGAARHINLSTKESNDRP